MQFFFVMEGDTLWVSHCVENVASGIVELDSFSELNESKNEVPSISVDLVLLDDLLEQILAYLPIASRAGYVYKRWHEIVTSERFLWNFTCVLSQKPWYFMFTSSDEPVGYAYAPIL
ncbi:F-box kelch-repeat At3g61590 [Olea europaea subsp. europaea]|uniref:F-box kelch-repeat At3g61590 n=1 Tax=Olea europaea subsp. europaea TaxID=158383 RepID=A0A8S0P9G0_OLEEU|nr:F-box kelch-repeat At3g61590 [Olea europaea subsp. europaea]